MLSFILGCVIIGGNGVSKDIDKATEWLQKLRK